MLQRNVFKRFSSFITLILIVLIIFFSVEFFSIPAFDQEKTILFSSGKNGKIYIAGTPSEKIKASVPELAKKYPGKEWKIRFKNGFAKEINLKQSLETEETESKKVSAKFLNEFSHLFGIKPDEAFYSSEAKLKKEKNLTYIQILNRVPVLNSHISFIFKKNRLSYVTSRIHPEVKDSVKSTNPKISPEQACEIAQHDISNTEDLPAKPECDDYELIIIPAQYATLVKDKKDFYLSWKITISSKKILFSYTYFIDALSGEVLNKYSNITDAECQEVLGSVYGSIYAENKNHSRWEKFKYLKVLLDDNAGVTKEDGKFSLDSCSDDVKFQLQGYYLFDFAKVIDCNNTPCRGDKESLTSPSFPVTSNRKYKWKEDIDDKKELTVFWHLNEMHDYFETLLGQDLMDYQLVANVDYVDKNKCKENIRNAFYVFKTGYEDNRDEGNIFFCPSDVSKESDVIYHEYTHGVIDHIPDYTLPYQDETGALNEGLADYFAAAKNNDPVIGEGIGALRDLTKVVRYDDRCSGDKKRLSSITKNCKENPFFSCSSSQYWERSREAYSCNDYGYVHHNSLGVSGALWYLRENRGLDSSYVDELVLKTVYNRKPTTFSELMEELIEQAESDGKSYESKIRAAFGTRGVPLPAITITSPNGGEVWEPKSTQTIRWTYTDNPPNRYVKIELYKSNRDPVTIVPNTPIGNDGNGSYVWKIPYGYSSDILGSDFKILITGEGSGYYYYDESDSDFTIGIPQKITVSIPHGGESFLPGSTVRIIWYFEGTGAPPTPNVKIELYKDGVYNSTITPSVFVWNNYYDWKIPDDQVLGTDYTIKITSTNDNSYTDTTDGYLTIGEPTSITITTPDDEEIWEPGTTHTIKWLFTGVVSPGPYVNIELYKDGNQVYFGTIASNISIGSDGIGSFTWTIPSDQPGGYYSIKVTSTSNSSHTDTSEYFFIGGPINITITFPMDGEIFRTNHIYRISWTHSGPGSSLSRINIELYKGGVLKNIIASETYLDGDYEWTIPSTQTPGTDYQIKIISTLNNSYTAISNYFSIIESTTSINILEPSMKNIYTPGGTTCITWSYDKEKIASKSYIKIELYKGGVYYDTLISGIYIGYYSYCGYNWHIPNDLLFGTDYQLKITSTSNSSYTDTSDNFTILPRPGYFILTTTPQCNGMNPQIKLTWTSSNRAEFYDVYRSINLAASYYDNLTETEFVDTAVTPGKQYYYTIGAKNSYGITSSNWVGIIAPDTCGQ